MLYEVVERSRSWRSANTHARALLTSVANNAKVAGLTKADLEPVQLEPTVDARNSIEQMEDSLIECGPPTAFLDDVSQLPGLCKDVRRRARFTSQPLGERLASLRLLEEIGVEPIDPLIGSGRSCRFGGSGAAISTARVCSLVAEIGDREMRGDRIMDHGSDERHSWAELLQQRCGLWRKLNGCRGCHGDREHGAGGVLFGWPPQAQIPHDFDHQMGLPIA